MFDSRRLVLPRRLIPALLHAHDHTDTAATPPVAADELTHAGALQHGQLTDHAQRIASVMTTPLAVVSVEIDHPSAVKRSTLWISPREAAWAHPVDGGNVEIRVIDAFQAPLLVAQLTDLGHRPPPPFCGAVTVPDQVMAAALDRRDLDPDGSIESLTQAGLTEVWADRLLLAHDLRRSTWRVSSVTTDMTVPQRTAEVSILDAGAAGYWQLSHGNECTTYSTTSLERVLAELRTVVPLPDQHEHSDAV